MLTTDMFYLLQSAGTGTNVKRSNIGQSGTGYSNMVPVPPCYA